MKFAILWFACALLSQNSIASQTSTAKVKSAQLAQNETSSIPTFAELLQRPVKMRQELNGVHPRLFFNREGLAKMRERAKTSDREIWQAIVKDLRAVRQNPPAPNDPQLDRSGVEQKPGDISQYAVAFAIAEASFAYSIERDPKYLAAAKKWLLTACEYDPWGYTFRTPNVDLPPAHLLYAAAFAYDLLFDDLTKAERQTVKNKLVKQSRLMYDYFKYKPKKRYAFSQNHTSIPMAGLAAAAYVLIDEEPEAKDWAILARAVFDRVLLTFGTDGYFYEGFHYFTFSFRWTLRYLDAHKQITGEDLYPQMRQKFEPLKYYVAHSILPDNKTVFDFADTGDGAENRAEDKRTETLYGDTDILYRLASVYRDNQAQAIADRVRDTGNFRNREEFWTFINRDQTVKPAQMSEVPTAYHFADNDTAFWRSGWDKNATAFAFRCAPPEGHHATRLAAKISDWRQSTGHAHPDANSFIIWANGSYLTGDTGYTGKKMTDDHNTILVDNRGQEKDGRHEVFKEVALDRLNQIKIAEFSQTKDYFYARGVAASVYYQDLGLQKFDRHFLFVAPDYFVVWDELAASQPREFKFLLNADLEIKLPNQETAELINKNAGLRVIRVAPSAAKSTVAPQLLLARGRPGSIEDGESEQRGVQLQTVAEKTTKLDFIHFLQPFSVANKIVAPQISQTADGLKIIWANGGEDLISLKSTEKFVERRTKNGKPKRIAIGITPLKRKDAETRTK